MKLLLALLFTAQLFAQEDCEQTIEYDSPVTIYDEASFVFEQETNGGFRAWAMGYYLALGPSDTLIFSCGHDSVTMNWLRAGCYQLMLSQDVYCMTEVLLRWFDYPLPVDILDFKAIAFSSYVLLQWRVANESDGVYYQPFRNGLRLADIWGGLQNYEYFDRTAQRGQQHEYFLACVEPNGQRCFLDSTTVFYSNETRLSQPSMECHAGKVTLSLPQSTEVKLAVFNILGRQVAVLADNYFQEGIYQFQFDNSRPATGVYFVRAVFDNEQIIIRKILLQK